ncbi:pyridoxine 5'-phosphate synthase [Roseivirga sp. E12]|uniref:pyridoxine 5'-phosphate synthase n=1 Tax=Roseivirga sp. E12 TaxID=2819237 RepID=UPI001ABCF2BE|nr:pyridoxine 5'-phosphate synthase [Roseivirga sp. E12]MBO3698940.1 pyridoxine 5'-phosphate synthase [Roseivirga sp. E12]
MTRLSVNINKVATLRNARGGDNPNVVKVAIDAERFGAEGITIHPRPDERHITTKDVYDLKEVVTTEFNIEGYPDERFLKILKDVRPDQATLVPDPPHVLTSNAGWDTVRHENKLKGIIDEIKSMGIRTSIFVEPGTSIIEGAAKVGTDRIELYTEMYATGFMQNQEVAISHYKEAAERAHDLGLGINAGHDLDLTNLSYLKQGLIHLDEVSIGHALFCDALYYGLENTIQLYLRELK